MSDRKFSLAGSDSFCKPGERRAVAGPQHFGPGRWLGRISCRRVASRPRYVFFDVQSTISLSRSVDEKLHRPERPGFDHPAGQLADVPDRPQVGLPFAVPCGLPFTSFWPSAVTVTVCGALASGLASALKPRWRIITVNPALKISSSDP